MKNLYICSIYLYSVINENSQLKKNDIELREKINLIWSWKENLMINNLDSKIINGNYKYNETLKKWIKPSRKIRAELLYRLSENGDNKSTFHELCDNKGPTLTLFQVNDGNIVGIYTPLSWDSTSEWKEDMNTFIFNLNKNQKYKKIKSDTNISIRCNSSYGPWAADFGCRKTNSSMSSITLWPHYINEFFHKGSNILPNNGEEVMYDLIETEIYKIIID